MNFPELRIVSGEGYIRIHVSSYRAGCLPGLASSCGFELPVTGLPFLGPQLVEACSGAVRLYTTGQCTSVTMPLGKASPKLSYAEYHAS
jgi:hypothetical protein